MISGLSNAPKLVRYDAMCHAIETASSVDEAKEIRDKAIALAAYSKQALNRENERKCCEIRIRAERRAGELLIETKKNGQRDRGKGGDRKSPSRESSVKLSEHGISYDQSSDWQKLAEIPKKKFEEEIKRPGIPTTEQIIRNSYPQKKVEPLKGVSGNALKIWGVLTELERGAVMESDPLTLFSEMTEPMKCDVRRLAPLLSSWLSNFPKGEAN